MRWTPWIMLVALFFLLAAGGPGAAAGDDAGRGEARAEARAQVLVRALDLLRIRMEARLGEAEALKAMGRFEEALAGYRSLDGLHAEGLARIEDWLARLGVQPAAERPGAASRRSPERPELPFRPPSVKARVGDVPFTGPANGAPIGLGGGAGGAFRGRGGKKRSLNVGGGLTAATAVKDAHRWLAAHQSPNGGWEAAGFPRWCDGKPIRQGPDGEGKALYDAGVTGLALCALLGAGYTNRGRHPFAKVVAKGLRYLKNVQDNEGCFGPRTSQHYVYNHATAALAMVEAYGMTGSPIFKGSAQKALDFIALSRNPYFAWRYGVKPGDNDTSVTGWMMMALKSAQLINKDATRRGKPAPLTIDEAAFDGVQAWIDKMTDPDYGRTGYIQRGGAPARPQEMIDKFPGDKSESMTGVGMLARIFRGENPRTSEIIQKGARLCAALPPTWNPTDGSIDMYYWYYATLALYQVGGPAWKTWNKHLKTDVVDNQRKDTTYCMYKGSWDPIGPWGPDGGRVYSTALMAMCLEVYYRYDRVFSMK